MSHEDERIATCTVVTFEYIPQRAAALGRGGRISGPPVVARPGSTAVQDLDVRVGVGRVDVPEGQLIGDDDDVRGATQLAERRRADF